MIMTWPRRLRGVEEEAVGVGARRGKGGGEDRKRGERRGREVGKGKGERKRGVRDREGEDM